MLTGILPKLALHGVGGDAAVPHPTRTANVRIREALCGLAGHDFLLRTEPSRIFLRCAECGHETCGWQIDVKTVANRRAG
jgi:hypothetical protein